MDAVIVEPVPGCVGKWWILNDDRVYAGTVTRVGGGEFWVRTPEDVRVRGLPSWRDALSVLGIVEED